MFEVQFYKKENLSIPFDAFFNNLTTDMKAKCLWEINLLQRHGNMIREPYSKYISDGVYELRIKYSSDICRVFYFFYTKESIILTNGYIKKNTKMSASEFKRAINYKKDYERRHPYEI